MLSIDYTKDLLNLQGVIVDKIVQLPDTTIIHIHLPVKPHKCRCCGEMTSYIHDYRVRTIKDISAFDKNIILLYKQRRYVCKHCGKRFAEDNSFSPKYYRVTQRLFCDILKNLENEYSFTRVAKMSNLSVSTVIRYFDVITYQPPEKLPDVIAIDEFIHNWSTPILNTFDCTYTNGFTEGCNNKIKVLKRNAYSYRNFKRFRNRILHMFNYKRQEKQQEKVAA